MTPRWCLQSWSWTALILGALVVLALVDPAEVGRRVDCPFHWATGLYCPGCGTLRAVHDALHGRLLAALSRNLLAVVVLPLLLLLAAPVPSRLAARWHLAELARSPALSRAVLIAVLGFWIARNLPLGPFAILAP